MKPIKKAEQQTLPQLCDAQKAEVGPRTDKTVNRESRTAASIVRRRECRVGENGQLIIYWIDSLSQKCLHRLVLWICRKRLELPVEFKNWGNHLSYDHEQVCSGDRIDDLTF